MVGSRRTPRRGRGSPRCLGVVSGFLLKLIRESVGLTQARLAEHLDVDVATIQGWESSRRPLTALQASDLVRLRSQLLRRGAEPIALGGLDDAINADLIIAEAVEAGDQPLARSTHPLGVTVHQRTLTNLITWPFTGGTPAQLRPLHRPMRRRGPVPTQPSLDERERTRFFDHLLVTADANPHDEAALLRRQAIYLLGFDHRSSTADWLHAEQRRALRNAGRTDHVASWVAVRSSAVALATSGDSDPLRTFVQHSLATTQQEQANLNYWAYWVGKSTPSKSTTASWDTSTLAPGPAFASSVTCSHACIPALGTPTSISTRRGHCCWPTHACSPSIPSCARRQSTRSTNSWRTPASARVRDASCRTSATPYGSPGDR